jgi:hypothetical protein
MIRSSSTRIKYLEEPIMADAPYAYVQDVPIDGDVYQQIVDRIGTDPVDGCLLHLCLRTTDGGLRYLDVWESEEACTRAFDERIHPAVFSVFKEIGFQPDGEPGTERLELLDVSGSMLAG